MNTHYNNDYFNWQKNIGAFGGWAELVKFQAYIKPNMNVVDFGCGGGFLLNNLQCQNKIGIEINDIARKNVEELGLKCLKYAEELPDDWADCIISNHALEHVSDPFNQISLLKNKLKKGGKIIFVVPSDTYKYQPADINYHLFCWSPMTLGNLFHLAGFKIIESEKILHRWPPFYYQIAKIFGKTIFNFASFAYGFISRNTLYQVRVVAEK